MHKKNKSVSRPLRAGHRWGHFSSRGDFPAVSLDAGDDRSLFQVQTGASCVLFGEETCFLADLWLQPAERWLPQTAEGETRGVFVSHPCELPG